MTVSPNQIIIIIIIKVKESCVRSCMMYGSETWPMKKGHESMPERTEMRMVRWMCGTSLRKKCSAELRDRMGIEAFLKRNQSKWFGHVEREEKEDWVRKKSAYNKPAFAHVPICTLSSLSKAISQKPSGQDLKS